MREKIAWLQTVRLGLSCLLAALAWSTMLAQEPAPAPKLFISILDGEGALNDIHQRTAREPIVEVQDENHKPIAGAVVLFKLPGSGPSGFFPNGAQTFSTVTDAEGRAVAKGLQPNDVQGSFDIVVTASYQGATAEKTIHQKNVMSESAAATTTTPVVAAAHGLSAKTWLIIAGSVAAAAAVAAIAATSGGNSTTITAGIPTVGPPPPTAGVSLRIPLHGHSR
jgi:hypothetical protein